MTACVPNPTVKMNAWLAENGPRELESLFRAIAYHPAAPILLADDDRQYREASMGAERLLGVSREQIIGRRFEEFATPATHSHLSAQWVEFLKAGDQSGTLQLLGADGVEREVEYRAKGNLLPVRHLLLLRNKPAGNDPSPGWTQDYALFLLHADGTIAAWYAGAERIYGYRSSEVLGQNLACLYPAQDRQAARVGRRLERVATEGHAGGEGWHRKSDGSNFWANAVTMALRDEAGTLQGFACVVRDFSDRYERDENLGRRRPRVRSVADESSVAGVVSGEFDRIVEMNDRFLEIVGYTREDLQSERVHWASLTPASCTALDEFAHEEALRFGACSPYEKEFIRRDGSRVPVLIVTAVTKISPFRWITFVTDLQERDRRERVDSSVAASKHEFTEIIGTSRTLKRVLNQVELVAPTDATVLILGETGTGKELIARALHRLSPRRNLPFVSVNCAAIPTGLLESELFGYERGAFTGALQQKIGRFEMANLGTLFLDEVGDIPLELQPKLLRALQEKLIERLGGTKASPIDVRLVAATNRNLSQMVGENLFRSDLYYRLKVFPIALPPLRDRTEDIALLARHFTHKYAERMGRKIERIPSSTMNALMDWPWPGNIRELENFIERSVILSQGHSLNAPLEELHDPSIDSTGSSAMEDVEREHILRILRETGGVVSLTAKRLRLPRTTLNYMMKKHGISRADAFAAKP
jgi:formate hydrogenlyase transcriptional activator